MTVKLHAKIKIIIGLFEGENQNVEKHIFFKKGMGKRIKKFQSPDRF